SIAIAFATFNEVDSTPGAHIFIRTINKPPNPRTARPATPRPITEPPEKETDNAFAKLVRAAWVVRTLAFVAAFMPKKPARALRKAPIRNETAIDQCEVSL